VVAAGAGLCRPEHEVSSIAILSTLIWAFVYFVVFVPLAWLYRLLGGQRRLGHGGTRADSYWISRRDRPFGEMTRQGAASAMPVQDRRTAR